jgi:tetratricopeptide (TPR) repeat protein
MQLKWLLSHTRGYLELGMIEEAAAELDRIPELSASEFDVRVLRALVLQEQKQWGRLVPLAARLAREKPGDAGWWIMWAYATRRAASLPAAEKILLEAETHHPKEATIQFNLGCYACQRGDLASARKRVDRAIALDGHYREAAETDPDLTALRESEAKA